MVALLVDISQAIVRREKDEVVERSEMYTETAELLFRFEERNPNITCMMYIIYII